MARSRPAACPTCCRAAVPSPTPSARVDAATAWGVAGLPDQPGRDADAIVAAIAAGELGGLVVGGVDPDDTADPAAFRAALEAARFVVSLEQRETDVTRVADVVFPVAPVTDKPGTFVTWEGRPREFERRVRQPERPARRTRPRRRRRGARVGPLGFRTSAEAHARMVEMGPWDGERASLPESPAASSVAGPADGQVALATWKLMLDNGSMQDGEKYLRATARTPVCRVSAGAARALGAMVTLEGDRGSVTLPVEVTDDLADDVVWVPGELHRQRRARRPRLARHPASG